MSFVISNKSQVAIQIHHNFESSHSCGLDVLFPSNKMIYDQNFLSQLKEGLEFFCQTLQQQKILTG